jgi:hypothetical protein
VSGTSSVGAGTKPQPLPGTLRRESGIHQRYPPTYPPHVSAPNPTLNHQDTKNTKQTEPVPVLTLFVSLCLCGKFLCRFQGSAICLTPVPSLIY